MNNTIKNSRFVGIDLGTTNTVVTYWDDTGQPKVIPNQDGEAKTPSVVFVGPGAKEILVGGAARNMSALEPHRVLAEVKREVGTDKVYFTEAGQPITPAWCQGQILKFCRQSAIKFFGDDQAASEAVVSVPAYFKDNERKSVVESCHMAGLSVIQLVSEPTAAGLAFGLHSKPQDLLACIADFGGGSYDVSLIQYQGHEANVLGTHGDKHLGGKDIDQALVDLVAEEFRKKHQLELTPRSHPADWWVILDDVVRQKHMLFSRSEVKICARLDGKAVLVSVSREKLREICLPWVEKVRQVTREAIQGAKVNQQDIKHVLLVGGSSRVPWFQEEMKQMFGDQLLMGGQVSPDYAIAEGAVTLAAKLVSSKMHIVSPALQAIPAPLVKPTDVMSHSLGVAVQDQASGAMRCSVILERNQPIPCRAIKQYASVDEQQTRFRILTLQGEDGQPSSECLVVAERELELPARSPTQPSIEVEMSYDASGLVKVVVRDKVSGRCEDITVNPISLSKK